MSLDRLICGRRQGATTLLARALLGFDLVEMGASSRFEPLLNFLGAVRVDASHVLRVDPEALGDALEDALFGDGLVARRRHVGERRLEYLELERLQLVVQGVVACADLADIGWKRARSLAG